MVGTRLFYLLIGCFIGFILGYMVRSVQERRNKTEEVDESVSEDSELEEAGFIRGHWRNVVLLLVVIMVAYSAFASQLATNHSNRTQHEQEKIIDCNQVYLTATIAALNSRTKNSQQQNDANVALQKSQAVFLSVFFVKPPATEAQLETALKTYFDALTEFTTESAQTNTNVVQNPYPSPQDFINCVHKK